MHELLSPPAVVSCWQLDLGVSVNCKAARCQTSDESLEIEANQNRTHLACAPYLVSVCDGRPVVDTS
jgi:hypothetical protein